ncbi:OsmC family protein [Aerococcaceae bacterium DSM 111176]|nr:OsmC family protein [Aerococcaceae bacterium DSM 111176]
MAKELYLNVDEGRLSLPVQDGEWVIDGKTTYSALEMLLTASAACGAAVFRDMLANSKIEAELKRVDIEFTRADEEENQARPIKTLQLIFNVDAADETAERRSKGLTRFVSRYCPVIQSLDPSIDLEEVVKFI